MLACWKRWCLGAATAWLAIATISESQALAAGAPPPALTRVAGADTAQGPAPAAQPPFLDAVARHLGVPPARLEAAVRAAELERWNAFASAHHIPEERAKAIRERIEHDPVALAVRFGNGGRRTLLNAAAVYLGMPEAELMAELRGGKSLADIAQARGRSADGLKAAVLEAAKAELNGRVQAGVMSPQARDQTLSKLEGHLDELITHRFRPGDSKPAEHGTRTLKAG